MKLYIRLGWGTAYTQVNAEQLREIDNNLMTCGNDGGSYEAIELDSIDADGNLYFSVVQNTVY